MAHTEIDESHLRARKVDKTKKVHKNVTVEVRGTLISKDENKANASPDLRSHKRRPQAAREL